jgi:hypothetical protein
MEFIIIGVAVFFNIMIIFYKFNRERYLEGLLDGALLVLIGYVFGGSYNGLIVGTVASALVSIYLLIFPPKILKQFG